MTAETRLVQNFSEFEFLEIKGQRMLLSRYNNMGKTTRTSESFRFLCDSADE